MLRIRCRFACVDGRHQASDGSAEGKEDAQEQSAKLKKAENALRQRKLLQRHLRHLQQHTWSKDILAGAQYVIFGW